MVWGWIVARRTPEESVMKDRLLGDETLCDRSYSFNEHACTLLRVCTVLYYPYLTLYVPGVFPYDQSCNKPGHHHDSQE